MTDINDLVEQAEKDVKDTLSKGSFTLTNALKRRGFPEAAVTIYLDEDTAHELVQINDTLTGLAQSAEKSDESREQFDYLDALAQELAAKIRESALTFHLRGISPGHIEQIRKNTFKEFGEDLDDEAQAEANAAMAHDWVAAHIVKIVNAEGAVDERVFKRGDIAELEDLLPSTEYSKIDTKVNDLSFRSAYIEQATDAGFLPKS